MPGRESDSNRNAPLVQPREVETMIVRAGWLHRSAFGTGRNCFANASGKQRSPLRLLVAMKSPRLQQAMRLMGTRRPDTDRDTSTGLGATACGRSSASGFARVWWCCRVLLNSRSISSATCRSARRPRLPPTWLLRNWLRQAGCIRQVQAVISASRSLRSHRLNWPRSPREGP